MTNQPSGKTSHRLLSLEVIGGFLDGEKFELKDGLNCVIGARGTGKTTVLELVRYAMDALAVASGDFIYPSRIGSFKIKGIKGDPVAMDNVFVNSHDFRVINVSYASHGVGSPFGFSGINFSKVISYRDNDIKVRLRLAGPDLVSIGANTRLVVSALS